MPSRPPFEGDTALNLRNAVLPEVEQAVQVVEEFLRFEHPSTVARNLSGGLRELIKARASIGLAARDVPHGTMMSPAHAPCPSNSLAMTLLLWNSALTTGCT